MLARVPERIFRAMRNGSSSEPTHRLGKEDGPVAAAQVSQDDLDRDMKATRAAKSYWGH